MAIWQGLVDCFTLFYSSMCGSSPGVAPQPVPDQVARIVESNPIPPPPASTTVSTTTSMSASTTAPTTSTPASNTVATTTSTPAPTPVPIPVPISTPFRTVAEERAAEIRRLIDENEAESGGFAIPTRRVCDFQSSRMDVSFAARNIVFFNEQHILTVHPMRFLRSPFVPPHYVTYELLEGNGHDVVWRGKLESFMKRLNALAVTEDGKHVLLQLAFQSCVPTAVAMLVLDHGRVPDYDPIIATANPADLLQACRWVRNAGLRPKVTSLNNTHGNEQMINLLSSHLRERGPGVLTVANQHVIVLDAISPELQTANIRDPYHGWALTIRLDALLSIIDRRDGYFLQIDT